jgi:hypothetical protein
MHWHSEQFHGARAVQIYCCDQCDKLQAEAAWVAPAIQPKQPAGDFDTGLSAGRDARAFKR